MMLFALGVMGGGNGGGLMTTDVIVVWEAEMCVASEILMVLKYCVVKFLLVVCSLWYIFYGCLCHFCFDIITNKNRI
jgi:hypothetical protein